MEGKIALEEHFSTELNNRHWDAKGEATRNGADYTRDIERRLVNPDLCLREMDLAGIELCVMSLTSPGVQSVSDKKQAAVIARDANDHAARFIKGHPDRLSAFAAVALQDPKSAADELERAVTDLGFKGALINGYTNVGANEAVVYLDEQPFWVFWDRVSKLNVPIYLHPREPLPSQTRSIEGYPELVGSAWAFTYETASHAIRLMLSGLLDSFPNLQIILGHLGKGCRTCCPECSTDLTSNATAQRVQKQRAEQASIFARTSG